MTSRLTASQTVAFCAAIFAGSALAVRFSLPGTHVAGWWAASAIGVCMLLLSPPEHRVRLGVLVGVLAGAGNAVGGRSTGLAVPYGIADALEVLIVVTLLTKGTTAHPDLRTWRSVLRLRNAFLSGSLFIGAFAAITVAVNDNESIWQSFLLVVVTHLAADVVIIPLAMVRTNDPDHSSMREVALHSAVLLGLAYLLFDGHDALPLMFVLFPLLMWAGARFHPTVASLQLVAMWLLIDEQAWRTSGAPALFVQSHTSATVNTVLQGFVLVASAVQILFMVSIAQEGQAAVVVRENEERVRLLLASARGTAMFATDLAGTITWFSPGAEHVFGGSPAELAQTRSPLEFFDRSEVEARAADLGVPPGFEVFIHQLLKGDASETLDWTTIGLDNHRSLSTVTITAIPGLTGRPTGYVAVVGAISAQREAEKSLLSALQKEHTAMTLLSEADRVKADFVSSVSHELRTPITSIVGYTELLTDGAGGALNATQHDIVERIDRNGRRLLRLIEDLLALSHVESGSWQFQQEPIDLRKPVCAAVDEVQARLNGLELTLEVDVAAQPLIVVGDTSQLERLVLNLLGNACKFTGPGGNISVRLGRCGDQALLSIGDDGIGIPAKEQGQLFQRFFRASTARSSEIQGTGLGLSIVRSIAEAHHGAVAVESDEGVGTTMTVTIPLEADVN